MKTFSKLAVLSALLASSASFALADTISLGSFATGTTAASLGFSTTQTALNFAGYTSTPTAPMNPSTPTLLNGTAPTYALAPGSAWAAPVGNSTWVGSIPNSGPGGTVTPGYGYYQFNTLFTAAGGSYNGTMSLMGDDTVEVLLNGSVIVPFAPIGTAAAPGFQSPDVISLNGLNFLSGVDANTFIFVVDQAGNTSFNDPTGLDFVTSFTTAIAPEPSTLLLLGTGLLSASAMCLRRRRTI
jgi:hypothetical protein